MHCSIIVPIRAEQLWRVIESGGIRAGVRVGHGGVEGKIESEACGARKQGS